MNGIVEVKENARINDVIEVAGGLTSNADLTNVNLAYIVEDGQKIYIPCKEDNLIDDNNNFEEQKEIISEGAGENIKESGKTISGSLTNINKADLDGLKSLPGIGEAIAIKILEYREVHGKFKVKDELKEVSGIGEAKYNAIKEYICV